MRGPGQGEKTEYNGFLNIDTRRLGGNRRRKEYEEKFVTSLNTRVNINKHFIADNSHTQTTKFNH